MMTKAERDILSAASEILTKQGKANKLAIDDDVKNRCAKSCEHLQLLIKAELLKHADLTKERGLVLFFDDNFTLLDTFSCEGDRESLRMDQVEIARFALTLNASHVALAHTHPRGATSPSEGDIGNMAKLTFLFESINIKVMDHYIVGHDFKMCPILQTDEFKQFMQEKRKQVDTETENFIESMRQSLPELLAKVFGIEEENEEENAELVH